MTPPRLSRTTPPRPASFAPTTVYSNSDGVRYVAVASNLEARTVEALNEIAWTDRITRAVLVEEILVAYARDCFPDRHLPTRAEAKYEGDEDPDDSEEPEAGLREGVRHFEHNELHWRNGHKGRAVAHRE